MHLSVAVPSSCGNRCKFCIANLSRENYPAPKLWGIRAQNQLQKRIAYARDAGCTSLTLTGEGEPLLNPKYLGTIGFLNQRIPHPFTHVLVQTSGMMLDTTMLTYLRDRVGVTGINLSLCHLVSCLNASYTCPRKPRFFVDVEETCRAIVRSGLTLRICINLTDLLNDLPVEAIFKLARSMGASQLTLRRLFDSGRESITDRWIREHRIDEQQYHRLKEYIVIHGNRLADMGDGLPRYTLNDMSVMVDEDCMSTQNPSIIRTMIIREDRNLYTRWDDKGSIIF